MEDINEINKVISKKKELMRQKNVQQQKQQTFTSKRKGLLDNIFSKQSKVNSNNSFNTNALQQLDNNANVQKTDIESIKEFLNSDVNDLSSKSVQQAINSLINISKEENQQNINFSFLFCKKFQLFSSPKCNKCNAFMREATLKNYSEQMGWRCYSSSCNKRKVNLYYLHPIFQTFQLKLPYLIKLFIQWVPQQVQTNLIKQQFNMSVKQIQKARKIWKDCIMDYYKEKYTSIILGEKSEVVEVDEAHFRRKYNKGRYYAKRGQWLLGITERQNGFESLILIPIQKRNKPTLDLYISQFVSLKCTMICSDSWLGYNGLETLGYHHKKVNHSQNFVVPNQQISQEQQSQQKIKKSQSKKRDYELFFGHPIHTQTIENKWMHLKNRLKQLKGQRSNYFADVFESLFYLSYKDEIETKSIEVLSRYTQQKYDILFNNQSNKDDDSQSQKEEEMELEDAAENKDDEEEDDDDDDLQSAFIFSDYDEDDLQEDEEKIGDEDEEKIGDEDEEKIGDEDEEKIGDVDEEKVDDAGEEQNEQLFIKQNIINNFQNQQDGDKEEIDQLFISQQIINNFKFIKTTKKQQI